MATLEQLTQPEVLDIETTTFYEQASKPTSTELKDITPNVDLVKDTVTDQDTNAEIRNVLGREVLFDKFNWAASSTLGTILFTIVSLQDIIYGIQQWRDRINNFRIFRARAHITIRTNFSFLDAGGLSLYTIPAAEHHKGRISALLSDFYSLTSLNQQTMNILNSNSVTISIDYLHPTSTFTQTNPDIGAFPQVGVYVRSPLNGVSTTLPITCWIHLSEVELQWPTLFPVYTPTLQSLNAKLNSQQIKILQENDPTFKLFDPVVKVNRKVWKRGRLVDNSNADVSSQFIGYPQGFLTDAGNKFIDGASSTVKNTIDTVTGGIKRNFNTLMDSIGLSKDQKMELDSSAQLTMFKNITNYNGTQNAHKLSLDTKNHISTDSTRFGIETSDTRFKHLARRSMVIDTFTMSTTNQVGDLLYSVDLSPWLSIGESTGLLRKPMFAQLAEFFTYAKGGFEVIVTFFACKAHKFRIEALHEPTPGLVVTSGGDASLVHRIVFDFDNNPELRMECPYQSPTPFLRNPSTIYDETAWNEPHSIGTFVIRVVQPLIIAAGGPSTIQCQVEIVALDDFELAMPCAPTSLPYLNTTPPPPTTVQKEIIYQPQGNMSSSPVHIDTRSGLQTFSLQFYSPLEFYIIFKSVLDFIPSFPIGFDVSVIKAMEEVKKLDILDTDNLVKFYKFFDLVFSKFNLGKTTKEYIVIEDVLKQIKGYNEIKKLIDSQDYRPSLDATSQFQNFSQQFLGSSKAKKSLDFIFESIMENPIPIQQPQGIFGDTSPDITPAMEKQATNKHVVSGSNLTALVHGESIEDVHALFRQHRTVFKVNDTSLVKINSANGLRIAYNLLFAYDSENILINKLTLSWMDIFGPYFLGRSGSISMVVVIPGLQPGHIWSAYLTPIGTTGADVPFPPQRVAPDNYTVDSQAFQNVKYASPLKTQIYFNEGLLHVEIPYYNSSLFTLNEYFNANDPSQPDFYNYSDMAVTLFREDLPSSATDVLPTGFEILLAGGNDFSMSHFLGIFKHKRTFEE